MVTWGIEEANNRGPSALWGEFKEREDGKRCRLVHVRRGEVNTSKKGKTRILMKRNSFELSKETRKQSYLKGNGTGKEVNPVCDLTTRGRGLGAGFQMGSVPSDEPKNDADR